MSETYHTPERKAGFTNEELEQYGDAVLMTWRDWVNLRNKLREELDEHAPLGTEPLEFWGGYRAAIFTVMQMMDETLS